MDISFNVAAGCCDIHCGESLTIYEVTEFRDGLLPFVKEAMEYRMDLSETEEIDTAGVQLLIALYKQADLAGGRLRLAAVSPKVEATLRILNLPFLAGLESPAALSETDK